MSNPGQKRIIATVVAVAALSGAGLAGRQAGNETTVVRAAPYPITQPVRPTYQDVSLKVFSEPAPYKFFRGRTATQTQRDAMEETLTGIALPEAWRYAAYGGTACSSQARKIASELSKITAKLGPIYEDNSLAGGSWKIVNPDGRHYSIEKNLLEDIRACSLAGSGVACGKSPYMTTAFADLLDIRIDDFTHRCVTGALFAVPEPVEPYNATRSQVGFVNSRVKLPPLTAQQIDLLGQTHAAHVAVSDWRCGTRPGLPAESVQGLHMQLEATAVSEDQAHFLRLKDFSGVADGTWDITSICKIARLQDAAHKRWMNAVLALDWREARRADNDHQLMHILLGARTDDILYRLSCSPTKTANCPAGNQRASAILR